MRLYNNKLEKEFTSGSRFHCFSVPKHIVGLNYSTVQRTLHITQKLNGFPVKSRKYTIEVGLRSLCIVQMHNNFTDQQYFFAESWFSRLEMNIHDTLHVQQWISNITLQSTTNESCCTSNSERHEES